MQRISVFLIQHRRLRLAFVTIILVAVVVQWLIQSHLELLRNYRDRFLEQFSIPALFGLGVLLLAIVALVPLWRQWRHVSAAVDLDTKDTFTLQNALLTALIQAIGGLVLISGLFFTWQQLGNTQEQLRLTQESQITDRYTKAVEQLGSDKLEVRLGAIYALERIGRDSKRDLGPILDILTAYVREKTPCEKGQTKPTFTATKIPAFPTPLDASPANSPSATSIPYLCTDIQAVLTVVGRTPRWAENRIVLDLHGARLPGAYLAAADLSGADLSGADLSGADLSGADLSGADLQKAESNGAVLTDAILRRTNLVGASLRGADFRGAILTEADLAAADLTQADLRQANLEVADLRYANLFEANLFKADLGKANLSQARLSRADLRETDISRANLFEVALNGATLSNANLSQAQIGRASLFGANLNSADLTGADLHGASLIGADLSQANLIGADFSDANLGGADLTGAHVGMTLIIRTILTGATMPDGSKHP
ncbi:MAG: pentapeptide repeat-containing protein [Anaerolineae bacterium]